jgi:glutamine synthetase
MLAAALDGIDNQINCPEPLNDVNVYLLSQADLAKMNIAELPGSLAEALRELDNDQVLQSAIGPAIYEAFKRAKWAEVDESRMSVTDWEVARYLETA